jgi:ATP-dependent DNA helicase PIF1
MKNFFELVDQGKNIFLTGSGGVGKSWHIHELIRLNKLKEYPHRKSISLTATTGIAALNIGGMTIHKFAGLGVYHSKSDLQKITSSEKWQDFKSRINHADIVIIDEISMLRSDSFFLLNLIFQYAQGGVDSETYEKVPHPLPFGGKQMIFTGDFLQLPPVVQSWENIVGPFCFQTTVWKSLNLENIYLKKVFRQSDELLISALNEVRSGVCSPATKALFLTRVGAKSDCDMISLTSLNKEADEINNSKLADICEEMDTFVNVRKYHIFYDTHEKAKKKLISHYFGELEALGSINVKKGARVLITSNAEDESYVNGQLGTYENSGYYIDIGIEKYSCMEDFFVIYDQYDDNDDEYISDPPYRTDEKRKAIQYEKISDYIYLIKDENTYSIAKLFFENNRTKNLDFTPKYVMCIRLDTNAMAYVERETTDFIDPDIEQEDGLAALTVRQFPIKLGWAISMHKSQGQTLKQAYIDPTSIFSEGQFYVALSRVQSIEGLFLKSFPARKIIANQDALKFYQGLES